MAEDSIRKMDGMEILDPTPNISTDIYGAISVESNPFSSQNKINHKERTFLKVDKRIMQWTDILAEMEALLQLGSGLRNMLYTSRSCAKALPQVNDENRKSKKTIYTESFNVLQPRINQLLMLTDILESIKRIVQRAVQFWQQNGGKQTGVPESVEERIIEILDLLVQLDNLKDMKASILNDFSHYKRCLANVREDQVQHDYDSDVKRLQQFLANAQSPKSHMFMEVRSAMQKIPGYEFVLANIARFCLNRLHQEMYMTPEEKHRYLRVIPHIFLLIDKQDTTGGNDDGVNVFALKYFKTKPYKELFKKYPVVPLFRDMHVSIIVILSRCPHFPADRRYKWEPEDAVDGGAPEVPEQYEISSKCWLRMRENYDNASSRFMHLMNAVKRVMASDRDSKTKEQKVLHARAKLGDQVRDSVIQCFYCLRDWSSRVKQQLAWKYSHPSNRPALPGEKSDGRFAVYEAAVLRNFTAIEKTALVDAISMIKTLCGLMLKSQAILAPLLRSQVHHEMQQFVQEDMRRLITRLLKKRKCVETQAHLRNLRDMVADWTNAALPQTAEKIYKKKKHYQKINFNGRVVGPSYSQLNLYRSLLASLYDPNSDGMKGGIFSFKDFDPDGVKVMSKQYQNSFFYPYLLSYDTVLRDMSDMGDLLFREYYLELARAEQFPLKTSLPWILIDHVLQGRNKINSVDNIITTLDIYNDAALRALHVIKQQYMYDEIEAEVNLVFDQLTVLLTEKIYTFHKDKAATLLLPERYKIHPVVNNRKRRLQVDKNRFEVAIGQKHLKLLGRSIDLNLILSQYVANDMMKDLETAVASFEAKDLTYIYDLHKQLEILRLTHKLMVEAGLTLDPFDSMYQQTLASCAPTTFTNAVTMHVINELNKNILQWYIYNNTTQRFIPRKDAADKERSQMPKVRQNYYLFGRKCKADYQHLCAPMHGFFGAPHCKAILAVLGVTPLPLIVRFCTERVEEKLLSMIFPLLQTFADELPLWNHPNAVTQEAFKASTLYIRFKQQLGVLADSKNLRPIVMHSFREIGNTLVFLRLLEDQMSTVDVRAFVHIAPLLNLCPPNSKNKSKDKSPFDESMDSLVQDCQSGAVKLKGKVTVQDIKTKANKIRTVYENQVEKASLLRPVLIEMQKVLAFEELRSWHTETPSNGAIEFTPRHEFHRLWSMILFMFSMSDENNPAAHPTSTDLSQFGDGFVWGGAAIVHLLGQRKRFELLDISSYLLAILHQEHWQYPPLPNQVCPPEMYSNATFQLFFQRSSQIRRLNEYVFALLESELMAPTLRMNFFHPPEDDTLVAEQIRTGKYKDKTTIRASAHTAAHGPPAASSASQTKRTELAAVSAPSPTPSPPPFKAKSPPPPEKKSPSPKVKQPPPPVKQPPPPKVAPPPVAATQSKPPPPAATPSKPAPPPVVKKAEVESESEEEAQPEPESSDESSAGAGEMVKAKWKYQGEHEDELSFPKGAMIRVLGKEEDGWWEGEYQGKSGFFPGNYVA